MPTSVKPALRELERPPFPLFPPTCSVLSVTAKPRWGACHRAGLPASWRAAPALRVPARLVQGALRTKRGAATGGRPKSPAHQSRKPDVVSCRRPNWGVPVLISRSREPDRRGTDSLQAPAEAGGVLLPASPPVTPQDSGQTQVLAAARATHGSGLPPGRLQRPASLFPVCSASRGCRTCLWAGPARCPRSCAAPAASRRPGTAAERRGAGG